MFVIVQCIYAVRLVTGRASIKSPTAKFTVGKGHRLIWNNLPVNLAGYTEVEYNKYIFDYWYYLMSDIKFDVCDRLMSGVTMSGSCLLHVMKRTNLLLKLTATLICSLQS